MIAAAILGLSLAEWGFVIAGSLFIIDRVLERTGRAPTVRLLREENEDLIRRNAELDSATARLETRIVELEAEVRELRKTSQAAVLDAIQTHERNAERRSERTAESTERTLELLSKIAALLERSE